jgi:Predicted Fe-S-cluster redox enzyme
MKTHKTPLVGKSLDDFVDICDIYNVNSYRAEQIFNWIYKNKINDFESFKNISKSFL